jgi:hypothetical protein
MTSNAQAALMAAASSANPRTEGPGDIIETARGFKLWLDAQDRQDRDRIQVG